MIAINLSFFLFFFLSLSLSLSLSLFRFIPRGAAATKAPPLDPRLLGSIVEDLLFSKSWFHLHCLIFVTKVL